MNKRLMVIIAAALAAATPVCAQDEPQAGETRFYVQTSGGVPQLCAFGFTIVYTDRTYLSGRLAGITGSLS
jgi:hypothetical protein